MASHARRWLELPLALSPQLLILMGLMALLLRPGHERLQALPALLIGSGLVTLSTVRRGQRRRELLMTLRQERGEQRQPPEGPTERS